MSDEMPDPVLAVMTFLRSNTAINAIAGTRVYRIDDLPAIPTPPYILVSEITDVATRQAEARVQCSCFAVKDRVASALSKTVRNSLHRKANTLLSAGSRYVWVISATDAGNTPDKNPEVNLYAHHRDITISYTYG